MHISKNIAYWRRTTVPKTDKSFARAFLKARRGRGTESLVGFKGNALKRRAAAPKTRNRSTSLARSG